MTRKSISKVLRYQVYEKYNGHCAYCGCDLEYSKMQVDHLNSFRNNGEDLSLDNLMPSCRQCNFYKGTSTIEGFRGKIGKIRENLTRNFIHNLALKYDLIEETNKEVVFYFEKEKEKKDE